MDINTSNQEQSEQQDILDYETHELNHYQYASQGQRFINYLIDNLLLRYTMAYVTSNIVVKIINEIAPDFLYSLVYGDNRWGIWVLAYFVAIFNYIIYYTLCEKLFSGYTLGKIISGTRALKQNGQELTFKDALLRSLCRCVPLETFSGFNTLTWHDKWTNTMVIKSR